jgi:peptide chain release factor 1
MWDEIEKRGRRYLELKRLVEDPASPGKPQYPAWLREFGRLTKFGALYDEYHAAEKAVQEAEAILEDPAAEAEFKGLAREELAVANAKAGRTREALLDLAESEDEDAARNVIVEIYKGVGGDESSLWVGDLFEMCQRYVEKKGWKCAVLNSSPGNVGGFSEISFRIEGNGAFGEMRFEGGGHRVQRVPKTEAQGRIHTSMARLAVLPEAEEVDVQIDPKDVREVFCAAGGPGGQNVNKVATQCQLTHLPTGITVHCIETRSQAQNRTRAWQILRSKLYVLKKAEAEKARGDARMGQLGSGDRSERIRTYNFPQGRCTDHRLEGEDKNWPIQEVLAGGLDGIHEKLRSARKNARTAPVASDQDE